MVFLVSKGLVIVIFSISQNKHLKDQLKLMLCVGSVMMDVKQCTFIDYRYNEHNP
jgi:hypothetical protein